MAGAARPLIDSAAQAGRAEAAVAGLVGVLCLTVAAYARFLGAGFAGSDSLPLVENSRLTGPESVVRIFTSPVLAGTTFTQHEVVYRPFVSLTFGVDYLIWGQWAAGYHLTNLAFHLMGVAAVWLLLSGLGLGRWSSVLGAAVFGLHPLVVASVPVISRRDSVVPVAACTLAAALLLQASDASGVRRHALTGVSLLVTAIALLSKETAYVAVALLPVVVVARAWSRHASLAASVKALLLVLPHLLLAVVLFVVRLRVLGGVGGIGDADLGDIDFYQYGTLLGAYLREQLWAFTSLRPISREQWQWLGFLICVGLVLAAISLPRRQAAIVALGAVWIIAFGVFSAVLKITTIGWLAYFALVGTAAVVAAGTEGAVQRLQPLRTLRMTAQLAVSGATLAAFTIFFAFSIADSALLHPYPQWQLAGEVQNRYFQALESCVTMVPDLWDEELVSLQDMPEAYQDGLLETDMLGVTLLEQYTAEAALRQTFPDRQMHVHVASIDTLHSNALQFECAPLPHGVELSAIY